MVYSYTPRGVCSRNIKIELDGDTIKNVSFTGGCSGNTQGISALVEGLKVGDAIRKLKGIHCGQKDTSCPDQLAHALERALEKQ